MKDKRRHKRFAVEALDISNNVVFATRVNTTDVSIYGLAFEIGRKLKQGDQYTLNLRGKGKTVTIKGIVVRSSLKGYRLTPGGDKKPVYNVGFKFLDIQNEMIHELMEFIQDYTGKNYSFEGLNKLSGGRLSARVSIRNPGKDILNFQECYKVRDISSGGMLIEGKQGIKTGIKLPMQISSPKIQPIEVIGEVIRCFSIQKSEARLFQIGIEFFDIADNHRKKIEELVHAISETEDLTGEK